MENLSMRRQHEDMADYEQRLYINRKEYGLTWQEVTDLLEREQHADTTRKESYGYLRRVQQEQDITFDNSVMFINDLHLPFERDDIWEIINKHKDEITTLVIAGDLMDCVAISSFPKIEREGVIDEMIYAHDFLSKLRKTLDEKVKIVIFDGNHEERWKRVIQNMNIKTMQELINPSLLDAIIGGFNVYSDKKTIRYKPIEGLTYIPHWYINIDEKIIAAHPKGYSQVDGRMCENVVAHFANRGENFDVAVFGHTHKYSQMTVSRRGGRYAVENGCLCKPHDYADSGRLGMTPQDYCYTIIKYNDNEPINKNNIKVYHLDDEINVGEPFKVEI